MSSSPARRGFMLIQLLVVIGIIVILLAILTPALDRAMYSAELAACGSTMKGLALSGLTYAFDHNRVYPSRRRPPIVDDVEPLRIRNPPAWSSETLNYHSSDLPQRMDGYVGIDA